jgi:hypothetical protein
VLVLLPPSEGKTRPATGSPIDLDALSFPRLTAIREQLFRSLVKVSSGNAKRAAEVLGLGPTQADALTINAGLATEPAARADAVYTGVLFSALDLPSLGPDARARADASIAVASGLFGLLRPSDHIPAYRMSGTVSLPRLGPVAGRWRPVLPQVIAAAADGGLIVDLRSGMYVSHGKPPASVADRTTTLRVLHEHRGERKIVSHFNKATKGRIVRDLLESGTSPRTVDEFDSNLRDLGWITERHGPERSGTALDVIVAEV